MTRDSLQHTNFLINIIGNEFNPFDHLGWTEGYGYGQVILSYNFVGGGGGGSFW